MKPKQKNDDEYPDLFGLTREERRQAMQSALPDFSRQRGLDGQQSGERFTKPLLIGVGFALAAFIFLLVFCPMVCLNQIGQEMCRSKNYSAAVGLSDFVLALNPRNSDAYCLRAFAEGESKQYEAAINDLNAALKIEPKSVKALFERGIVNYKMGKYQAAVEDFGQASDLEPANAQILVRRGIAQTRLGNYDRAIADYEKATHLDPTNAEAMYNKNWAMDLQYDQAMEGSATAEKNAIEPSPLAAQTAPPQKQAPAPIVSVKKQPETIVRLTPAANKPSPANTDVKRGGGDARTQAAPPQTIYESALSSLHDHNYGQAIRGFDQVLASSPRMASAYVNRGLAYANTGKYGRAIDDYSACLLIDPDNASAHFRRARAYDATRHWSEAKEDYLVAARLNPRTADKSIALANADLERLKRGQAQSSGGSVPAASGAHEQSPQQPQKQMMAALSTQSSRKEEHATVAPSPGSDTVKNYAITSQNKGEVAERHYFKGRSYVAEHNDRAAIEELRQSLIAKPNGRHAFSAHVVSAGCFIRLQDYTDALTHLQQAQALNSQPGALFYEQRARAYIGLGRSDLAAADIEKARQCGAPEKALKRLQKRLTQAQPGGH